MEDLTGWSLWWEYNKDGYLALKDAIYGESPLTGGDGFFLGQGRREVARDLLRPSREQVRERVVPALLHALESESHNDIVTGCLVALAKIGDERGEDGRSSFATVIRPYLSDSNQEISETAALALGILASDASLPLLVDLLHDTDDGRRAVGKHEVDARRRAFAAYGIGMVGNATASEDVRLEAVSALVKALESDHSSTRDVPVACTIALGMVPLRSMVTSEVDGVGPVSAEGQIELLRGILSDETRDEVVRAHAPRSIVRLLPAVAEDRARELGESVAREFLTYLAPRSRVAREVRQSVVLALGQLGDCDQDPVDRAIRGALSGVDRFSDRQVRFFSCVALGQVGGRDGTGPDPDAGRREVVASLTGTLSAGNSGARWAALGLAVMGHARRAAGASLPREVSLALRRELELAKSPEDVGAFSVAAGILGDEEAIPHLLEKLQRTRVDRARGYVAVGLGLVGARTAIEEIREVVRESEYRPELLEQAAIALGLLGDKQSVDELIAMLADAKSLATQASLSSALGFIGDARSIEPLVELLEDDSTTATARGFAAVALGIVSDTDAMPWNTELARDLNYRAATYTLSNSGAGTGVLNIL